MVFERFKNAWKKTKAVTRGYLGSSPREIEVAVKRSSRPTGGVAVAEGSSFAATISELLRKNPQTELNPNAFYRRAQRLSAANAIRVIGCPQKQTIKVMRWSEEFTKKFLAHHEGKVTRKEIDGHFVALAKMLGERKAARFLGHCRISLEYVLKLGKNSIEAGQGKISKNRLDDMHQ